MNKPGEHKVLIDQITNRSQKFVNDFLLFQLQTKESHLINYNPNALVDCKGKVVETEVRLLEATPEESGASGAQLIFEVINITMNQNVIV